MTVLEALALECHFTRGGEVVKALDGVDFQVVEGEQVALVGTSGSGKSTLLNLLGGLARPTGGALRFRGRDMATMTRTDLASYRRNDVGMVFQSFNLLPRYSALQNVELPMLLAGTPGPQQRRARALQLLEQVGLAHRKDHRPAELSGGEQQRVAIARSLANDPAVLLADEPTGNLDSRRAAEILDLLLSLDRTLVVVTHDAAIASRLGRALHLADGRLLATR